MNSYPKVAIVYLSFHCQPYINDVISALKQMTYPKDKVELVIVDNPHPQRESSVQYLIENVLPLSGNELPHITLLPQKTNLYFAGGNNVGIKWALDNDFDYVYLHNSDGFVAAGFLEPLVDALESNRQAGAIQSLLLLYPETELINSSGNSFHYLGQGFCNNFRVNKHSISLPAIRETAYASGAAVLLRADLLRQYGLWDEDFVLYHEDIEYSFRLRAVGYKILVAANSIFYHKYSFGRNQEKFYYIERNRLGLMLIFFKWPTLLLMLPMAVIFELGLLLYAWRRGWLKEKLRVFEYWSTISNWKLWLEKRRQIQKNRKVKDKELLRLASGRVGFEDKEVNIWLLSAVGNPLMVIYWWILKKFIVW